MFSIKGKDKVVISPIFKWSDNDVWDFIHGNNMPYCDLYDLGFHRIGCLFCPLASVKQKRKELEMFPLVAERICDAITAKTRQRINPQFTLNVDIQEHNIIVFDDILTTGATLDAVNKLLPSKNCLYIIGINNN